MTFLLMYFLLDLTVLAGEAKIAKIVPASHYVSSSGRCFSHWTLFSGNLVWKNFELSNILNIKSFWPNSKTEIQAWYRY